MGKVLIIGAGGVGGVAAHKCAMNSDVFSDIWLASKTLAKCEAIKDDIQKRYGIAINTAQVDAEDVKALCTLISKAQPDVVLNLALPYQDLAIMEACLECQVPYIDTACYETPDIAGFEYKQQWELRDRFQQRGLMALLGAGFDPGVTNVFCAYAQKHLFDEIKTIDILDCNAGDHGKTFATNFNPEINIREIIQPPRHWVKGQWVKTPIIFYEEAIHFPFDYPDVGPKESYLLYHEEMESLVKHIKGLERIRFWMTFSDNYLMHLKALYHLGLTRIDPVVYEGKEIVPLRFLKELLPDPGSLGKGYKGKTVIGCVFAGKKDHKNISKYIYNICDHAACWKEVSAQAIAYTTGVPAMISAMMLIKGLWKGAGVFNIEEMDPDPFMSELMLQGLPWNIVDFSGTLP